MITINKINSTIKRGNNGIYIKITIISDKIIYSGHKKDSYDVYFAFLKSKDLIIKDYSSYYDDIFELINNLSESSHYVRKVNNFPLYLYKFS